MLALRFANSNICTTSIAPAVALQRPHYVTDEKGNYQLYLLVHGWNLGKFAVLKHAPSYKN